MDNLDGNGLQNLSNFFKIVSNVLVFLWNVDLTIDVDLSVVSDLSLCFDFDDLRLIFL